ncbi:MAG TPA: RsmD family RNA methyltransferase [Thermoanaerobaculia bacterium]|nr:RsmD family RNA methyltransferase [Thermoanaerobaculia bacterium]
MRASVRLSAGTLRGRKISIPTDLDIRPTSDKARQAFFNIIGPRIEGSRFLDLFAGTGAFAFEAVSRGAAAVVAVDRSPKSTRLIEATAAQMQVSVETLTADALEALERNWPVPFDVVYADPPYDYVGYQELVDTIDTFLPLAPGATVGVEHRSIGMPFRTDSCQRLIFRRDSRYGNVAISIFDTPDDDNASD